MLNEPSLRKPGFQEGIKVKLGDGQEWTFPPVKMRVVPTMDSEGTVTAKSSRTTMGSDVTKEINAFVDYIISEEDWNLMGWLTKRMTAAAKLLMMNYDLSGEQLAELLYWEQDDQEIADRWQAIDSAMLGIVPKVSAAGSD